MQKMKKCGMSRPFKMRKLEYALKLKEYINKEADLYEIDEKWKNRKRL